MIKIFRGAGVVKTSKPLPPTNNFCLYPPPVLRCFWKDPLMTPYPHHPTSSILHCYPLPIHHPFPKNFDHTPFLSYSVKVCKYCGHRFLKVKSDQQEIGNKSKLFNKLVRFFFDCSITISSLYFLTLLMFSVY